MIRLGLTGYPLQHTLSPLLHRAALDVSGLQGEYALYPVRPGEQDTLQELVRRLRSGELDGLNVTIPHKQTIIRCLDGLTPAVKAIGAVNTIYLKGGKIIGENTDFAGFLADLPRVLPDPSSAIVLGAGGAARAVVYALHAIRCDTYVVSRQPERARELVRQSDGARAIEIDAETLREVQPDLVVNATPAGMFPNIDSSAWPAGLPLPKMAAIYDLVYHPPETRLTREARAAGLEASNGLGMLIEQAALAFELWTGYPVPRPILFEAIAQAAQ